MVYGDYPDLKGVKKILVVKLRHLGDVLLTGAVFAALQEALPGARIDGYIYTEAFPMLQGHPAVGELIGYDRSWKRLGFWRRLQREWEVLRRIRRERYDCVVNLTEGDRGAVAAWVSGARIRVGVEPRGKWQRRVYTHAVKEGGGQRHTVEKNLDAVRRMGIFPRVEGREIFLHVPDRDLEAMRRRVGEGPFVVIHPASRWRFKCWPVEKMRALAKELRERGKRLVFTAGPDVEERAMAAAIAAGTDAIDLAGKISLKELAALIQLSELLVCVDSVPLHMASALKKPVVAIFGPTSEINWGPWRNPHARVVAQRLSCRPCYRDGCGGSKMSDCLQTLSVDAVLAEIERLERFNGTKSRDSKLPIAQSR